MCSMGRHLDDECKLHFVQPKTYPDGSLYAQIDRSEIDDNINRWDNTLVGYVLGNKLYYHHLKACITRLWKPSCSLEIHSRENGYFFL